MIRIRGVKCAISTDGHLLQGDGVLITNPKHVEFARKRRKDFRPENRVCAECAKVFTHLYNMKLNSAIEKKQRHSLTVSSSSSLDDFDRIVYQTPRTKHLRNFVKQNAPYNLGGPSQELNEIVEKENQTNNENAESTIYVSSIHSPKINDDCSVSSVDDVGLEKVPSPGSHEVISDIINNSQNLSQDVRPLTNATTTTTIEVRSAENNKGRDENSTTDSSVWRKVLEPIKRKRVHFAPQPLREHLVINSSRPNLNNQASPVSANSSTTSDDEFDDFQPSLNALNGTRLPHIQPIPKRRQFQHAVSTVQDIYMQGITGG